MCRASAGRGAVAGAQDGAGPHQAVRGRGPGIADAGDKQAGAVHRRGDNQRVNPVQLAWVSLSKVVRPGRASPAEGMLSKPTTDRSRGMAMPISSAT